MAETERRTPRATPLDKLTWVNLKDIGYGG